LELFNKEKAKKVLEELRLISVEVVEYAANVREQLKIICCIAGGELEHKYDSFPIIFKGVNYLAKMNNDTIFLSTTPFARLFCISKKSDPFLLTAATPYFPNKGKVKRGHLSVFMQLAVSASLLKRIKVADLILLKEKAIRQRNILRYNKDKRRPRECKTPIEKHFPPRPLRRANSRKGSHKVLLEINNYLKPLKIRDLDVPKLLQWYKSKLSDNLAKSYCAIDNLLEKSKTGNNPIWLGYASNGTAFDLVKKNSFTLEGLAVIHIDGSPKQRVVILHASVLNEEAKNLPDLLQKLMSYIWTNINSAEIRVNLFHFIQHDKQGPYENLKSEFQKLKFKWKTLVSDENGNRVLTLGANRPEDKIFDKTKGLDCKSITFKHGVILTHSNKSIQTKELPKIYSLCSYLQIIKEVGEITLEDTNPLVKSLIKCRSKLSTIVISFN